ncbi:uncharacterized protein N7518_001797 [Penicillium psychrosexuale]|uniref:uncharacterized protein n=1 Tax=Penicillium psychrosexuale TaxID=1002107 RepID=UPI0025459D9F|nr:uncharacterized protein N7518_001797 [Penicillium psychrosexuale]KAJ5799729.1 hypothetical protein N7518_001797 [Penicillium psychrosexuale]
MWLGFRIISRKINGSGLFVDDWLIIIALIFEYGISIAGVVLLYNGLGTHIVEISPEQLVIYLKTLFTGSILYTGCIASIKLSILMLYRRLFPAKSMKYAVNLRYSRGLLYLHPNREAVASHATRWLHESSKFYYGLQVPNIATDAIILLMPMHIVWTLPISKVQKLGLSGIFILGVLTLIFDIIRLVVLIQLSTQGEDITYNQVPASVWTCIEPAVGIVAACLSNMRPLFKVIHTKVWSRLSSRYATHTNNPSDSQINEKGIWPRQTPSPSNSPSPSGDFNQSPTHNQSAV